MRRTSIQWTIAIVLTVASALWQRATGPTHPVRGSVTLGGETLALKLERTHSITGRQPVVVRAADEAVTGSVTWRRYPTDEAWRTEPLVRRGDTLSAALPPPPLPLMPAAGKLEYVVRLERAGQHVVFPERPAVTRFKGDVPAWVLIPHVAAMFLGMLFSNRAALAAGTGRDPRRWALLTTALILLGGFVLGPIIQKLAFGAFWTGIPWGYDLTDNKTLIAGVAWLVAVAGVFRERQAKLLVVVAALVTLVVFIIPHSVWGSQVDWTAVPR